jgi:hypothetical protein
MVEADSHLNLLPLSKLHTCKSFEPIDIMSVDIWAQPYSVILILLGSDFGDGGGKGNCKSDWAGVGNGDGDSNGNINCNGDGN